MKRLVRYIILLINLVAAIGLLLSYLSPFVNPEHNWWPSMFGFAYPYLLLANILFVIIWFAFYWKYSFISILCVVVGYNIHNNYFQYTEKIDDNIDGINVLSFNVKQFYSYLQQENEDISVLDFIASQDANIICLQETKLQKSGQLNPLKLKELFPGINHCQLAHQSTWNGPVTFTSYPIINMGEIRFDDTNNMVIFTDITVDSDTMRIYNCHLQSYGIRPSEYSIMDSISFNDKKINEMKLIGNKLRVANQQRSFQVSQLKAHIDECLYPVLVCGDFNDTPISYTYQTISADLNDAFVESGKGISNTYRGKLPPFRIDYILYSDDFEAFNYKRHKVEYSDHFPISATVVKKNKE